MLRTLACCALLGATFSAAGQQPAPTPIQPVSVAIESTLKSAPGQIRQYVFDGNPKTNFTSAASASKDDHVTIVFEKPVAVKGVIVATGRPDGSGQLGAGVLETSSDGKTFAVSATFQGGEARSDLKGASIQAVRIRVAEAEQHPLAIREITIDSDPPLRRFQHPVEFTINVDDAPEMKEWAEKAARICERHYDMICAELMTDGFRPRTTIAMTLKNDYKGVAAASGGRIVGSVSYFKNNPGDFGAMIHETAHCVQDYRTRGNPGWLVEGVADYVRFFKYEPGKIGRIKKDPHYNDSYRTTAAFLNFVSERYDKQLVRKLNKAMREGEYRPELWQQFAKKTVQELDEEWRRSLRN